MIMISHVLDNGQYGCSTKKSISHCMAILAALDSNSTDGEKDFYHFMTHLYKDMYEQPEKYVVPTALYDEYMKTQYKSSGGHKNDPQEGKLRNSFQYAIQFYADYFYQMGLEAEGICDKTNALIIPAEKYEKILRVLDKPLLKKENAKRYAWLCALGIKAEKIDGFYIISACKKTPKMYEGLLKLCSMPESKYKWMNYLRLDYKGAHRNVPDIDDIKQTLTAQHAAYIETFLPLMVQMNAKYNLKHMRAIVSGFGWKVTYTVKGKSVFGFFAEPGYLEMYIYFNKPENITAMAHELTGTDLFDWYCACFPEMRCACPYNKKVAFAGAARRICGMSNKAVMKNPNGDDVEKCVRLLGMFRG